MKKVSQHIILWIIALSILNTSIDIAEFNIPASKMAVTGEQDQYNEIESIVELVMDETSDHEQKLPDTQGNDQQSILKKSVVFDFSLPVKKEKLLSPVILNLNSKPEYISNGSLLPEGFTTLLTQPPDFI